MASRRSLPSLAPPFKVVRKKMQGKRTIVVKYDPDGIKTAATQAPKPPEEEGEYTRTKVHDSWES